MPKRWRSYEIVEDYTQDQWNAMYKKAEKGKKEGEIADFNEFYNTAKHADDPDIKKWNEDSNR